jgi:hypothetical protein
MTESGRLLVASIHDALHQILANAGPADRSWKLESAKRKLRNQRHTKPGLRRALVDLLSMCHDLEPLMGDAKWQVWALFDEDWDMARDLTLYALGTFVTERANAAE